VKEEEEERINLWTVGVGKNQNAKISK